MPKGDEGSSPRDDGDHAGAGHSERLEAATRLLATLTAGRARAQAMAERHLDFPALVRVHAAGLGQVDAVDDTLRAGDTVARHLQAWRAARTADPVVPPAPRPAVPAPDAPSVVTFDDEAPEAVDPAVEEDAAPLTPPAGVVSGYLVEPGAPPVHEGEHEGEHEAAAASEDADADVAAPEGAPVHEDVTDEDVTDEPTADDAVAPGVSVAGPDPESEELYTYRSSYEIEEDDEDDEDAASVTIGLSDTGSAPDNTPASLDGDEALTDEASAEEAIDTLNEADGVISPVWQASPEDEDAGDAPSDTQVGTPRSVSPRIMLAGEADEADEETPPVEQDWGDDHFGEDEQDAEAAPVLQIVDDQVDDDELDPRDVTGPFTVVDPDDAAVDATSSDEPEASPARLRVGGPEELAAAPASDEFLHETPATTTPSSGGLSVSFESADDDGEWEDEDDGMPRLTDDEPLAPAPMQDELELQPVEEIDPAVVEGFMDTARTAEERGDLHGAIVHYGDALDLMPDHRDAHVGRGRALMELGDYAAAMSDFQRAEDLNPGDPAPLVEMGHLYFARKEYRRAIEFYDQGLELEPGHAMALCRRGMCHHYRRTHRQAFQDLQKAYSLDPDIPNIKKYVQMAVKAMDRDRRR